ncbi:MAG: sterol desaturase family protein [Erythrobacter sp.]|nr:sterol desaturase family protein [Erythrobacter sp.]
MGFMQDLAAAAAGAIPAFFVPPIVMLPYILAEQLRPARERPQWRDYAFNIVLSAFAIYLTLPAGILAGMASEAVRSLLPWHPIAIPFDAMATAGLPGMVARVAALTFLPLLVHELWFYWSHRLEHRIGVLWEFHKLHHSDTRMNCSTFARDHFLQNAWRAFFSVFTVGLVFDLSAIEAGQAAIFSGLFLMFLSLFYHSAIRVEVPWLDRIVMTPQLHRIHHSVDPQDFDHNFADVFPFMDMLFGTYRKPQPGQFAATGLPDGELAGRSLWQALVQPIAGAFRRLRGAR